MKKYVLSLVMLVFSFIGFNQVIDMNNVDYDKLKQKVFLKINEYRHNFGIDTTIFSSTIESQVSIPNINKMIRDHKLYHPGYSISDQTFINNLSNEYVKLSNGKCYVGSPSVKFIGNNGEIICSVSKTNMTYDEFAELSLQGWLNSSGHRSTIEKTFTSFNGYPGLAACRVVKVGNEFWVVFNFMQLLYM